jgi:hypothetical protein
MVKILFYSILLAFSSCQLNQDSLVEIEPSTYVLSDSTSITNDTIVNYQKTSKLENAVNLIAVNCDLNKEEKGRVCDTISDAVYDLIYNDSLLTIEEKLDLIHILRHYQTSATKLYRAKIMSEILAVNKKVISQPEYLFAFSVCSYCDSSIFELLSNMDRKREVFDKLPREYVSIYESYESRIFGKKEKITGGFMMADVRVISSTRIRERYSIACH